MPNHPHEFTDTDPGAMEAWLEMLRSQSAGEKIAAVLNSSRLVLQMYEMGVRRLHPEATDREVLLRVAARHLPADLMIRAYGWDPEHAEAPEGGWDSKARTFTNDAHSA